MSRYDELEIAELGLWFVTFDDRRPVYHEGAFIVWEPFLEEFVRYRRQEMMILAIFSLAGLEVIAKDPKKIITMSAARAKNVYTLMCDIAANVPPRSLALVAASSPSSSDKKAAFAGWAARYTVSLDPGSPRTGWAAVATLYAHYVQHLRDIGAEVLIVNDRMFGKFLVREKLGSEKGGKGARHAPLRLVSPLNDPRASDGR